MASYEIQEESQRAVFPFTATLVEVLRFGPATESELIDNLQAQLTNHSHPLAHVISSGPGRLEFTRHGTRHGETPPSEQVAAQDAPPPKPPTSPQPATEVPPDGEPRLAIPAPLSAKAFQRLNDLDSDYVIWPDTNNLPHCSWSVFSIVGGAIEQRNAFEALNPGLDPKVGLALIWSVLLAKGRFDHSENSLKDSLPAKLFSILVYDETTLVRRNEELLRSDLPTRSDVTNGPDADYYLKSGKAALFKAQDLNKKCSPQDNWCAARHLVGALLLAIKKEGSSAGRPFDPEISAATRALLDNLRLHQHEDDARAWIAELAPLGIADQVAAAVFPRRGGAYRASRFNELSLGVRETAEVIATIFRTAAFGEEEVTATSPQRAGPPHRVSDFVFALFGEWGRGKSTLIREVGILLNTPPPTTNSASAKKTWWGSFKATLTELIWGRMAGALKAEPAHWPSGRKVTWLDQLVRFYYFVIMGPAGPRNLREPSDASSQWWVRVAAGFSAVEAFYRRQALKAHGLLEKIKPPWRDASIPTEAGYASIEFSAWKYPSRPEVWIHLYETIRAQAMAGGFLHRLRLGFRLGLLEAGWGPLLLGVTLLALTRLPLTQWAQGIWTAFGWVGCISLLTFILRSTGIWKLFAHRYNAAPEHSEKLGMQAVVGADLARLLRVWIRPRRDLAATEEDDLAGPDFSTKGSSFSVLLLVVGAALSGIALMTTSLCDGYGNSFIAAERARANPTRSRVAATLARADQVAKEVGDRVGVPALSTIFVDTDLQPPVYSKTKPIEAPATGVLVATCVSFGILGAGIVVFAAIIAGAPKTYPRLILIVDDLDRCEPEQMLAVIESLRLFVDDEPMRRRLQMAMLMDRRLLEVALWVRAKKAKFAPSSEERGRFLKMQREKLFLCEMEMPPLTEDEREELLEKLISEPNDPDPARPVSAAEGPQFSEGPNQPSPPPTETAQADPKSASPAAKGQEPKRADAPHGRPAAQGVSPSGAPSTKPDLNQAFEQDDVVLSAVERGALRLALRTVRPGELTPRAIVMAKVRFQLVRLLLREHLKSERSRRNGSPNLDRLEIEALALRIVRSLASLPSQAAGAGLPHDLERIAAYVACDGDYYY